MHRRTIASNDDARTDKYQAGVIKPRHIVTGKTTSISDGTNWQAAWERGVKESMRRGNINGKLKFYSRACPSG